MKVIYVYYENGDYGALEFERYFQGKSVDEIIERFFDNDEEYDGDFDMELYEFGEVDEKFIEFIRDEIHDYDDSKHRNFYLEGTIIQ